MSNENVPDPFATEDHWEIYVTFVDDKPAVILVDVGIAEVAPIVSKPSLVWLWIHLNSADEEGFPDEEEDIKLNEIEDSVTDALEQTTAKYVGRITTDGRREFYFYADDPDEFRTVVSNAMGLTPEYKFEVDDADDEAWEHYSNVLYPSPEDFQQINNQHVISRLYEAGDPLNVPRPVDHFANFTSEEDRDAFATAAESLGFEVVSRPEREPESEYPYSVGLIRIDSVDAETIDQVTFELFELAQEHDGEYDGWASKVVKAP
jgi:uncharacterized protein (TIGR01619 family)